MDNINRAGERDVGPWTTSIEPERWVDPKKISIEPETDAGPRKISSYQRNILVRTMVSEIER